MVAGCWSGPKKTTREQIIGHGYPAEHHEVETEDGNKLSVFRIPYSHKLNNKNQKRPIVFLQHGLLSSSDVWVVSGPNDALAFLLADSGFDVWMGNYRGNEYSKKVKEPSWKFSWHEVGYYDVAAMIDYVLKKSGEESNEQKSIHYVGYSQGTTAFFVLTSLRPEYNEKIKTAHMLSPVAILKHTKNKCLVSAAGTYIPDNRWTRRVMDKKFWIPFVTKQTKIIGPLWYCRTLAKQQSSANSNETALKANEKIPLDASWNQILHYLFNHKSGHFRQFDRGTKKNLKLYNSQLPPDYPVEEITSVVHLWYADNDDLVNPVDVLALAERLPKKVLHHIEDPIFGHSDYTLHNNIRKLVNEPVINIMKEYDLNPK